MEKPTREMIAEADRLRRQEVPNMLRDKAWTSVSGHVALVLDVRIALQIADDLELAIETEPDKGYG